MQIGGKNTFPRFLPEHFALPRAFGQREVSAVIKMRPEEDLDSGWGDDEDSDAPPSSGAAAAGKDLDAGSDEIDEGWDEADLPPAPQPRGGIVLGRTSRSKEDSEVARAKAATKAKKRSAKKAERRAEREALRLASQKKPQKARAGGVVAERAGSGQAGGGEWNNVESRFEGGRA